MNNYAVTVLLVTVGDGLSVTMATEALPKMVAQMMSGKMQHRIPQINESGFNAFEMQRRVVMGFIETKKK